MSDNSKKKLHKDFGKFLGGSSGNKIMGMMQNMGWKPGQGLGREKKGRVNPIISDNVRTEREGLGYGGRDERVDIHETAEEQSTRQQEDVKTQRKRKLNEQWKKKDKPASKRRRKEKYVMEPQKADIDIETGTSSDEEMPTKPTAPTAAPVLDMRSNQGPKEYASMTEVHAAKNMEDGESEYGSIVPELRHNVRLLASLSLEDITELRRQASAEKDRLEILRHEVKQLSQESEGKKSLQQRLERVHSRISDIGNRVHGEHSLSISDLSSEFEDLKQEFGADYFHHDIHHCALSLAAPLLEQVLAEWKPLKNPTKPVEIVERWRPLLDESSHRNGEPHQRHPENPLFQGSYRISTKSKDEDEGNYGRLVWETVVPHLRRTLAAEWSVEEADSAVRLVKAWLPVLTPKAREHLLEQIILPRLYTAVEDWTPRGKGGAAIHRWLHPWLPVLGERIAQRGIYSVVRQKLTMLLRAWEPADSTAHDIVLPWKYVFEEEPFERLVSQQVIPKLSRVLQNFEINPAGQDIRPFEWVMLWNDVIPDHQMLSLLDGGFFKKWFEVLYEWLNGEPDFEEVKQWYDGWKNMFPESLRETPHIRRMLKHALDMMNAAVMEEPIRMPNLTPEKHRKKSRKQKQEKQQQQEQFMNSNRKLPSIQDLLSSSNTTVSFSPNFQNGSPSQPTDPSPPSYSPNLNQKIVSPTSTSYSSS
eukprot:gb/GECH01008432.1/.p1 GENE.gb/GECH01008432.1/~~gb/GECH01008432.1/.p1  ORF type:complete len:701 (+),score=183.15 gb/GECH01008432.1/:1-2103(+)